MSKARYRLAGRAVRDLTGIRTFSSKQWGVEHARLYIANLYATFETLAESPEIGVRRNGVSGPFLFFPTGTHIIVYERIDHGILVFTVLHRSQNLRHLIADLKPTMLKELARLRTWDPDSEL